MNVRHTVWFRSTAQFVARREKKMFMCQMQSRNIRAGGANPVVIQKALQGLEISLGRTKRARRLLRGNRLPLAPGEGLLETRC